MSAFGRPTAGCDHCSLGKGRRCKDAGVYLAVSKSESARPGWTLAACPAAGGFLRFCFIMSVSGFCYAQTPNRCLCLLKQIRSDQPDAVLSLALQTGKV